MALTLTALVIFALAAIVAVILGYAARRWRFGTEQLRAKFADMRILIVTPRAAVATTIFGGIAATLTAAAPLIGWRFHNDMKVARARHRFTEAVVLSTTKVFSKLRSKQRAAAALLCGLDAQRVENRIDKKRGTIYG
jgi:hypothetical protein